MAVDGGGTKTAFCITDVNQKDKHYVYTGSTNYKSVGIDEAQRNLKKGLEKIMAESGINHEQISFLVFGLSGYDSKKDHGILTRIIDDLNLNCPYHLCNDAKIALYSAADVPGIVTISGTGSITLGVNSQGEEIRAGGWGYNFSDLGSGHWIGRQILTYMLMYCDGYFPYFPIFSEIKSSFGIQEFKDFPGYITANDLSFTETAAMAKLVVEKAQEKEKLSLSIIKRAAFYLAQQTHAVYRRLDVNQEQVFIVMAGGVFKNNIVQEPFKKYLLRQMKTDRNIVFADLKGDPVDGGIKLGLQYYRKLKGGEIHKTR